MADINVTWSFRYKQNNMDETYRDSFTDDIDGTENGPVPGAIAVTMAGVNVDLSGLTTPGWCVIKNVSSGTANWFEYGIWDGTSFYPLGELSPGESTLLKLSRNIQEEYGTGTGTTGEAVNRLRLKAGVAACKGTVRAFEA